MSSGIDPLNLILLAVAAVVMWRLWSVLGTRTGTEKPPIVLTPTQQERKPREETIAPPADPDEAFAPKPVWQGHAEADSDLARGLDAIAMRSPGFAVPSFLAGAAAAYEMVLEAYAEGNKAALKPLLAREIYDSFAAAIDQRAKAEQTMKFQFVGVKSSTLKNAALVGNKAQVEVAFVADMISATLDKAGSPVDGDDKDIRTIADLWTFERDVTSRDPNWKLVATDDDA